jgi:ribosome-binding protein aMBF1 (putative translation factor)
MSTRSSSGPDILEWYRCTSIGEQLHARAESPRKPQGQGFSAKLPVRFAVAKPKPGYPKQIKTLGDHVRAKRIELGLVQKDVGRSIGVAAGTVTNWEVGATDPEVSLIPAVIGFLGYNPLPAPRSFGESIRRARLALGWSVAMLAAKSRVDPATVARLEVGSKGMTSRPARAIQTALGLSSV